MRQVHGCELYEVRFYTVVQGYPLRDMITQGEWGKLHTVALAGAPPANLKERYTMTLAGVPPANLKVPQLPTDAATVARMAAEKKKPGMARRRSSATIRCARSDQKRRPWPRETTSPRKPHPAHLLPVLRP